MQATTNYFPILDFKNVANLPLTGLSIYNLPFTNVFTSRFLFLSDGPYGPIARAVLTGGAQ